jgi:cytochrome c biogenesis protein CcmG, thiol:disulfide interchange protein DsbE
LATVSACRTASSIFVSVCLTAGIASTVRAEPLDLSALHGRVVYLDFWASWCAPCRQSFPWMDSMQKTYGPQGLSVVAINVDHDRGDAEHFLEQFHPRFEVRFDPEGAWAQQFKVTGMPTSLIIDRRGAVRFTHIGFWPADGAVAAHEIRELLDEKTGDSP